MNENQLGDFIKSGAVGKTFRVENAILEFEKNSLYIKIGDQEINLQYTTTEGRK